MYINVIIALLAMYTALSYVYTVGSSINYVRMYVHKLVLIHCLE